MKRFKEISRKIVSIKAFTRRSFLDAEADKETANGDRTRDMLLTQALMDPEAADTKLLYSLSKALLEESSNVSSGGTPSLYYALAIMEWIIYQNESKPLDLSEESLQSAGAGPAIKSATAPHATQQQQSTAANMFSPAVTLRYAEAHFELWSRKGVAAEEYHLHRARQLYELSFRRNSQLMTAATQFAYCKVLSLLGDMEAAAEVAQRILSSCEHDADYPNYLFYTGGVFKALGQHEKANNFFFEAAQVGPPKLFSKLEMMMIISRTIEEATADDDVEEEDAFRMVHAHMLLEGLIDENLEYDDWISQSHTWLSLGDKCASHHMYSLATDLYGLGIMKDPDAFRKPMLWLRFAKACKRCGRAADGVLAVKQALTYDPFNPQLLRTLTFWSSGSTAFQDLLRCPLADILQKVPSEQDRETLIISRTQAILKGVLERRGMNLGMGNRRDITRRMTARVGVLLEGTKFGKKVHHPVILTVRPAWSGLITNIRVFDMEHNHLGAIPLRDPFAPIKETGVPRKLTLTLSCRRVTLKVRRGAATSSQDSDDDEEQVLVGNRLVYRKKAPVFFDETVTELKFTFTDLLTGQYTCRRMKLSLNDMIPYSDSALRINEFTANEYGAASGLGSEDTSAVYEDRPLTSASIGAPPAVMKRPGGTPASPARPSIIRTLTVSRMGSQKILSTSSAGRPVADFSGKGAGRRMSLGEEGEVAAVTETNIESAEILRAGYSWKGLYYALRIINDVDVTQVTFLQLRSNKVFVFLMAREHIDRTLNIHKRLPQLMEVLASSPLVKPLMEGGKGLRPDQAAAFENPSICVGRHCFVNLHPRSEGATIILLDPNSAPILGTGFEVIEADGGVVLDSRPGSIKAASIRKMIVGSFKCQPSKRFQLSSSFSFRNNAIDEFLGGNLNPLTAESDLEEDEDESEGEGRLQERAPPMLGGRKPPPVLATIDSHSTIPEGSQEGGHDGESLLSSAELSRQPSAALSQQVSFVAPLQGGSTSTPPRQHLGTGQISTVSSDSADEGDTFDMSCLRSIPVKASASVATSTAVGTVSPSSGSAKAKKPARQTAGRVPAARVRSLARRNMTEGATFEDALAAAAELQKNMAAFEFESRSSKSGKVNWAAWEAEKAEEARAIEAGELPPSLFVPSPPVEGAADEDGDTVSEGEEGEGEGPFAAEEEEESFLRHIVDVPWIEELGSIEVVEYVLQDLLDGLLAATVKYITDQYVRLPIFPQFVNQAVEAGVQRALKYWTEERPEDTDVALDEAEALVLEETLEELVDDIVEERVNKLNLMAYKAALAEQAQAAAAERAKGKKGRKPVVIHAHPGKPAAGLTPPKPTSALANAQQLKITIPDPEPEPEPEAPRQAAVPFSQPYRAAPDSPVAAEPVKYNVQKILSRPDTVIKHSSRPFSKRDNLVPVVGGATVVNKKRHNAEFLLSAHTYQPPQHMGNVSPQSSIYTGTFSRNSVFSGSDSLALGLDEITASVKVYRTERPNSRAHLLHFNSIDPLPVLDPVTAHSTQPELTQPGDPLSPSQKAQGLRDALCEWGSREGKHTPLLTVGRIAEANQQPYKPGAPSLHPHRHTHLSVATDDDGSVSICSENTNGTNPVFQTVQRRKLNLPVDEDSVFSVGSASRAGARRSPNRHTMMDFPTHGDESSLNGDLASLGDESGIYSMVSLRSTNGLVSVQPRMDPLQVQPERAKALRKHIIVQRSLDDKRYLGYVKERPLAHSSHWRAKLFSYLAGLRDADQLRKHVTMLSKACKLPLTPEEAVCALADTAGCVGEVCDKLRSLEFQSELKLVCRSLHVRSMVCMLDDGERLFRDCGADTFGENGEFDDLSEFSDQLIKRKSNLLGAEVSHSLQHMRSVPAKPYRGRTNSNFSKTAPHLLQPLQSSPSISALGIMTMGASSHHLTRQSTRSTAITAPEGSFSFANGLSARSSFASEGMVASTRSGSDAAAGTARSWKQTTSPPPSMADDDIGFGDIPGVILEGESESERIEREQPPSLTAMFHLGREDSLRGGEADDGDDNSSVTMSLGSLETRSWYPSKIQPILTQAPVPSHYPFSRTDTNNSITSVHSAESHSSTPSQMADQVSSRQLTPGIRSILTLPRQKTTTDIVAQSPTIARRASFVPIKFTGPEFAGSKSRLSASLSGENGDDPADQMGPLSGYVLGSPGTVSAKVSPLTLRGEQSSPGSTKRPNRLGSSGAMPIRAVVTTSDAAAELEGSKGSPAKEQTLRRSFMQLGSRASIDFSSGNSESAATASPSKPLVARMMSRKASLTRMSSVRMSDRIDDLLVEHGDTPVAVMCRRDLLRAQQDEVLLKSNKNYIRAPIEKKIGQRSSFMRSSFIGKPGEGLLPEEVAAALQDS